MEIRVAWLVPRAHGTPTMKLWSFDVRSWGPIQATLWREKRANLEGALIAVLAERARSEGARSTRAIEDRPGRTTSGEETSELGGGNDSCAPREDGGYAWKAHSAIRVSNSL
jgi:hypothetical protein